MYHDVVASFKQEPNCLFLIFLVLPYHTFKINYSNCCGMGSLALWITFHLFSGSSFKYLTVTLALRSCPLDVILFISNGNCAIFLINKGSTNLKIYFWLCFVCFKRQEFVVFIQIISRIKCMLTFFFLYFVIFILLYLIF